MTIYYTLGRFINLIISPIVYIYSSSLLMIINRSNKIIANNHGAAAIKTDNLHQCGHTEAQHAILRKMHENKNIHVIIPVKNISMLPCDQKKQI